MINARNFSHVCRAAVLLGIISTTDARADVVSFSYTYSGSFADGAVTGCVAPNAGTLVQGTGLATLLGQVTVAEQYCIDMTGGHTGSFLLTSLAGDQVFGTLTNGLSFEGAEPGLFTLTDTFTITGGTGRFAGVTGGGSGAGTGDGSTGSINLTRTGTLSTPIPEPGTFLLFGAGIGGVGIAAYARRRQATLSANIVHRRRHQV